MTLCFFLPSPLFSYPLLSSPPCHTLSYHTPSFPTLSYLPSPPLPSPTLPPPFTLASLPPSHPPSFSFVLLPHHITSPPPSPHYPPPISPWFIPLSLPCSPLACHSVHEGENRGTIRVSWAEEALEISVSGSSHLGEGSGYPCPCYYEHAKRWDSV